MLVRRGQTGADKTTGHWYGVGYEYSRNDFQPTQDVTALEPFRCDQSTCGKRLKPARVLDLKQEIEERRALQASTQRSSSLHPVSVPKKRLKRQRKNKAGNGRHTRTIQGTNTTSTAVQNSDQPHDTRPNLAVASPSTAEPTKAHALKRSASPDSVPEGQLVKRVKTEPETPSNSQFAQATFALPLHHVSQTPSFVPQHQPQHPTTAQYVMQATPTTSHLQVLDHDMADVHDSNNSVALMSTSATPTPWTPNPNPNSSTSTYHQPSAVSVPSTPQHSQSSTVSVPSTPQHSQSSTVSVPSTPAFTPTASNSQPMLEVKGQTTTTTHTWTVKGSPRTLRDLFSGRR